MSELGRQIVEAMQGMERLVGECDALFAAVDEKLDLAMREDARPDSSLAYEEAKGYDRKDKTGWVRLAWLVNYHFTERATARGTRTTVGGLGVGVDLGGTDSLAEGLKQPLAVVCWAHNVDED
jgi:hypothetical protein